MRADRPLSPAVPGWPATALLLLCVAALVLRYLDTMWSTSVDLAHHYALTARLYELGRMPVGLDPSLGEMNVYPRMAHQAAALVGHLLDSPLVGLQVVTLLSLAALWGALGWMVQTLPRNGALAAVAVIGALLWMNGAVAPFDLHGVEITGNFFYAQLVGQAFAALVVAVSLAAERRALPAPLRYALLVLAVRVATAIHLQAALALLCFLGLLLVLELRWRGGGRKQAMVAIGGAVAFALAGLAAIVSHPAYAAMRDISKNDGTLTIRHFETVGAVLAWSALIALASALLLWRHRKLAARGDAPIALKYIGLYGLAMAGLCLVQGGALQFGMGSPYAVKKYIYCLNTIALIELGLLPVLLLRAAQGPARAAAGAWAWLPAPLLTAAGFCAVMAPIPATIDVPQVAALEHSLLLRKDLLVPVQRDKFTYVVAVDGLSPVLSYMFSIGLFHVPRSTNAANLLHHEPLSDWPLVGTVISSEGAYPDQTPACRRAPPANALAVLDGACIARQLAVHSPHIGFGTTPSPNPCTLTGFGDSEPSSTWTVAAAPTLRCPLPLIDGKRPTRMVIEAAAFLNKISAQRVTVTVAGRAPVSFVFDAGHALQRMALPLGGGDADQVEIRLSLPDARSPKELGLSGDERQLGLAVRAIDFE